MLVRQVVFQLVLRDLVLVAVRKCSVRRLVALMSSCGRCLRVRDVGARETIVEHQSRLWFGIIRSLLFLVQCGFRDGGFPVRVGLGEYRSLGRVGFRIVKLHLIIAAIFP
jgi:hypothetical protein